MFFLEGVCHDRLLLFFYSYGLGIYETKLPNGVSVWGHGGGIPGFATFAGGVIGGKHTLAISLNSIGGVDIVPQLNKMMQIEFNK